MADVRVMKRGKVYQYQFEIAPVDGKRKYINKSGFKTKKEAFDEGVKAYNEYEYSGKKVNVKDMSYSDYLDYWVDNYAKLNLRYSTIMSYCNIIKNHIKPRIGHYRLSQLDTRMLQEMMNSIYVQNSFSKCFIASILKVLKGSLKYACYTLNYINSDPAENVHAPRYETIDKDPAHIFTQEEVVAQANESYKTIDTMTSSFVTTFMPYSYYRNINLNTALNYINGTILEPGEVFSYCKTAGPFNRTGYVFYYEFVGNGVCQIATTTYNAALLGGLEILKRYPHAKKSLYVAGGLDATVASYSSGWCVDMQFKNTYDYPIYIKAYSVGDQAHVEFWSNHDAKKGLEYTTSSTKIGVRGYRTFLHTWKDGEEIDVQKITDTWYTEE